MARMFPTLLLALLAWPALGRAADSYDHCTGFIDSLPAVIQTQGRWCLRSHLYTGMVSGDAITVSADNVTIDCHDFRLSNLGAGPGTQATGIGTLGRDLDRRWANTSVRNCRVQGFDVGIHLYSDGARIERNSVDQARTGIASRSVGPGALISHNRVSDTRERQPYSAVGIVADNAVVESNTVKGTSAREPESSYGIRAFNAVVTGNAVLGYPWVGIEGGSLLVRGNTLRSDPVVGNFGIRRYYDPAFQNPVTCRSNVIQRYAQATTGCHEYENTVQQ